MPRKRYSSEQVINKLHQAEVFLSQENSVVHAYRVHVGDSLFDLFQNGNHVSCNHHRETLSHYHQMGNDDFRAELLEVEAGAPLLFVTSVAYPENEEIIEITLSHYRADRAVIGQEKSNVVELGIEWETKNTKNKSSLVQTKVGAGDSNVIPPAFAGPSTSRIRILVLVDYKLDHNILYGDLNSRPRLCGLGGTYIFGQ